MQHATPVSDMDVSGAEQDIGSIIANSSSKGDAAAGAAELGYQGWAARHLVLAFHRIFAEQSERAQWGDTGDLVSESLEHRGVIFWCLTHINSNSDVASAAPTEADRRDEDVFHDGLTDFYHVWTLAEAFLLDSIPLPAAPLLRWLKMYSLSGEDEAARSELDETERVALEADAAGGSADPNPAYWDALRSLVVGVAPRRAAELLRSHPEGRDNASEVGALARQLENMPLLLREGGGGAGEDGGDDGGGAEAHLDREGFFETWTRWQKGCKAAAGRFGVVVGVGDDRGGGDVGPERRQLRWLWGVLCGERGCLVEATNTWSGFFAAVLAYERPDTRKEEVASVMRECTRVYSEHQEEAFLTKVIRDASAGAVDSILKFARDHGDTLALSVCATHLVDVLSRAKFTAVTHQQRSWFFRRLADRLRASPCGFWELAATYLSGGSSRDGGDDEDDEAGLLRELALGVVPESERATHELVEWCRARGLGEEVEAAVCRARGAAWIAKTGLSAVAMGTAVAAAEGETSSDGARVPGACGKAAYWLAKGGGWVQLERLCAEVSERLMVEVYSGVGSAADVQQAQQVVLAEADGVLAAVPPGVNGPELSFLGRYKEIADLLSAEAAGQPPPPHASGIGSSSPAAVGPGARLAGALAVDMLAPRGSCDGDAPVAGAGADEGEEASAGVTVAQVHALLAKLQALVASEHRVGSVRGVWNRSRGGPGCGGGTLATAPAPYGFCSGGGSGVEQVSEIRRALAGCLGAAMMAQNAAEAAPEAVGSGRRRGGRGDFTLLGTRRLPAEALVDPRVAV
ncbi:expressed unknown protein [Ectocarpus siliculosus]|uniref:Nuclear pore complex protein Nup85 n=1 Tax=Ectocarpus siliculosus TaxID=2880 RepID=D8LCE2_ECTSI|nr:expressed unknown protein [Ectocarpus siliculosus]|eukprot:CBN78178.1 expressed unknown protein [Ectocarpus siliculosus]